MKKLSNKKKLHLHLEIIRIDLAWLKCFFYGKCATEEEWRNCMKEELEK